MAAARQTRGVTPFGRKHGLSAKQERFVREYMVDQNGQQSATRAGYSEKTAAGQASSHLTKPKIVAALAELQAEAAARLEITSDRVLKELAKIGFCNMADFMSTTSDGDPVLDFTALTRDQTAALQEVTVDDYTDGRGEDARDVKRVKFRLCDKRAALVDLGRHLNLFAADNEHRLTGADGKPLIPPSFGVRFPDGFPGVGAASDSKPAEEEDAAGQPGTGG